MTKPKISWPQTPADVRQFIGSSFDSFSYGDKETRSPHMDDRYCISAHDLLSAFSDWVEFLCEPEQSKFKIGDRVRKTKGSQWQGIVVGNYSTALTPEGYAVESDTEKGSVQIYPASALELCEAQPQREPVAWADECRNSLVTAIYSLASDFENAIGAFGNDAEARKQVEGSLTHARRVASKWDWNGVAHPALPQPKPLSEDEIYNIGWELSCQDIQTIPEYKIAFARAVEATHGIK